MSRLIFWNHYTWKEIEELDRNVILLLPIGSCEQHSLHLPLGMDYFSAERLAEDIAKKNEKIYVLPGIPYGVSEHHMDFRGTITLRPETLINIVEDIVGSLHKHGFNNIVIINGHGGNTSPLEVAIRNIKEKMGVKVYLINPWELARDVIDETLESDVWGHACEFETSEALYIIPDLVRKEKIEDPQINKEMHELIGKAHMPWHTIEITNTGSLGYPTKASKEKGEKLYKAMLERTIELIKRLYNIR